MAPHNDQHSNARAVVFDLDGTLVDAFADITAAVNAPLRTRGLPLHDVAAVSAMVGDGAGVLIERATPSDLPHEERRRIHEEMLAHYRAHPADMAIVYTGVFDVLAELRAAGIRLAILSNKPHEMTLETCRLLGLSPYFEDIIGEDETHAPRKPDPRGLREQLQRLGARRAVLVGDGVPDGQVAARLAIPFVAALWGTRTREQLAPLNPAAFASEPRELTAILLRLLPP